MHWCALGAPPSRSLDALLSGVGEHSLRQRRMGSRACSDPRELHAHHRTTREVATYTGSIIIRKLDRWG